MSLLDDLLTTQHPLISPRRLEPRGLGRWLQPGVDVHRIEEVRRNRCDQVRRGREAALGCTGSELAIRTHDLSYLPTHEIFSLLFLFLSQIFGPVLHEVLDRDALNMSAKLFEVFVVKKWL